MSAKVIGCRMCSGVGRVTKHRHDPETNKLHPVGEIPCTFCGGTGLVQVPRDTTDLAEDIRKLQAEVRTLWSELRRLQKGRS